MNTARPSLESLEPRQLLSAGDVTAAIVDGVLIIEGSRFDDQIIIDQAGLAAGQVRIASADGQTTINTLADPLVLDGFAGPIRAKLLDGDDAVTLQLMTLEGNVSLDGGKGNNEVILDTTSISGDLKIKNKDGDQTVSLTGSQVGGDLKIDNKKGDSQTILATSTVDGKLQLNNKDGEDIFSLSGSTIGGDLKINNQKGDSQTTLDTSTIAGRLQLKSMKGRDSLVAANSTVDGRMQVQLGDRDATVELTSLTVGELDLKTGKGRDELTFTDLVVEGKTTIKTADGQDEITVTTNLTPVDPMNPEAPQTALGSFGGTVSIDTGKDNDTLTIAAVFESIVRVNGGKGDDSLDWLTGSTFAVEPLVQAVETIV